MTSKNAVGNAHESEAGNRERADQAHAGVLVWRQLSRWTWETQCGRFRIERFVPGTHEGIRESDHIASRYRALRRTPEWWFEAAPNEASLDAAQRACEGIISA